MKKLLLLLFLELLYVSVANAQIVYEDKGQRWNITGVVSNDDYTVICCDITILDKKPGCFGAHELENHTDIYVTGSFGKYKLVGTEYEGFYKPWNKYYKVHYLCKYKITSAVALMRF